jgi:ATP-binding cassette, subfamily B, bacterial
LAFSTYFIARLRGWYLLILLLQVGASASGIAVPYAIGDVIRAVSAGNGVAVLTKPLLLFAGLGLVEVLCLRAAGGAQLYLSPLLTKQVTSELFAYAQHHSQRYFGDRFAGALAHRIAETATGVAQALWAALFDFLPIAVKLTVAIALLALADVRLAAFVALWAVIFISVSYWLARRCRPFTQQHAAARSTTTGHVVDAVTNIASIRLFARGSDEQQRLDEVLDSETCAAHRSHRYMERIRWFQHLSSLALKLGALGGALWLWRLGVIDAGTFVMTISMALLIIAEGATLARRMLEFFEYVGNIENGVSTLVRPHEVVDAPEARALAVRRGAIEFRGVSFHYHGGARVFERLNVSIPAGQRVGLVGYSGSGKSTFVNLILRQYDPQVGAILVDGIDLRRMTLDSLREQIGLIPQEPGLFHRTLAENIRYGRLEADEEEVQRAAREANAHEFIVEMKDGYRALVGERGVKLSGGQRQRIAIARVLLKNAPILIMDEATSSLDSVTERAIQRSLDAAMAGKTVIVVAHRLSTIAHLDRILVFDGGRIVEDGNHAVLLAQRGLYHRLWSQQVDGFLPERQRLEATPSIRVDTAELDQDSQRQRARPRSSSRG